MLSVRVTGEADGEYVCALSLEPQAKVRASDTVQHEGDLTIVVAHDSAAKLRGATVDWSENRAAAAASWSSTRTSRLPRRSPFPPCR